MYSYRERISYALDLLTREAYPYLEASLRTIYRDQWRRAASESFRKDRSLAMNPENNELTWDAHAVLTVMWDQWNSVFRHKLGHSERSLVSELREFRNRWAHQEQFDFDDTYRVLDSVHRLLQAIAPGSGQLIAHQKREMLRNEFSRDLQEATERARLKWRMWRNIIAFIFCGMALIFALVNTFGIGIFTGMASVGVVLLFSYFIWETVSYNPPLFGPHECGRCGRIIYIEPCPYCVPSSRPQLESPVEEAAECEGHELIGHAH